MTPNNDVQMKDSVQLQTAVRMFLEYLLEHKEILQSLMQKQVEKNGDSASTQTGDTQIETTPEGVSKIS